MGISIDKKAARFGRWGLGIPRNIRKGTDKQLELLSRTRRRFNALYDRDFRTRRTDWVDANLKQALAEAEEKYPSPKIMHRRRAKDTVGSNHNIRELISRYRQASIFKRPRIAAQLRQHLSQRSRYLEGRKELAKNFMILRDLQRSHSPEYVAMYARKHGYGIYADVMPIWYKHVLQREMPAIVRKKMQLQRKGHKINFNPSDLGDAISFNRGLSDLPFLSMTRPVYNKLIASNADPFVPGMLYGAKDDRGIAALLQGDDVWFTPHRDIVQGYSGTLGGKRPYIVTLNPESQAVAGYRSDGKPLLTSHIANDIYNKQLRDSIQQGVYHGERTYGRAQWGNRPDYQAVAYLKPLREGAKNWRNTGQFRVFRRPESSGTSWQQIKPIPVRDKYEHFYQK